MRSNPAQDIAVDEHQTTGAVTAAAPVPEIISREEARAKGLKRYFTGEPCKHGHVAERRVCTTQCLECWRAYLAANPDYRKESDRAYRAANRDRIKKKKRAYRAANRDRISRRNRDSYKSIRDGKYQVYIAVDGDRMKIGVSSAPIKRIAKLKTGNPGITLMEAWDGCIEDERAIHDRLDRFSIWGEWFVFSDETVAAVRDYMQNRVPRFRDNSVKPRTKPLLRRPAAADDRQGELFHAA